MDDESGDEYVPEDIGQKGRKKAKNSTRDDESEDEFVPDVKQEKAGTKKGRKVAADSESDWDQMPWLK